MLGTLKGALEVRAIRMTPDSIRADVSGTNELVDGIIQLTRITVRYSLRIPAGTRDVVDRALSRHREKCPTARSLEAAIAVEWTAEIVEDA
jgi:uncharacterized OsmC-like protein